MLFFGQALHLNLICASTQNGVVRRKYLSQTFLWKLIYTVSAIHIAFSSIIIYTLQKVTVCAHVQNETY